MNKLLYLYTVVVFFLHICIILYQSDMQTRARRSGVKSSPPKILGNMGRSFSTMFAYRSYGDWWWFHSGITSFA